MKTLAKYIIGVSALLGLSTAFSSCQDDFETQTIEAPEATLTPNISIAQLKADYWQEATNYATKIEPLEDGTRLVVAGRVISSDEAGNVFKNIVIQDETGAIALSINSYNLYLKYRRGQEIVLDLSGMYIGKYAGLEQIGFQSWYENGNTWQVGFMSPELFASYAELNGFPDATLIDTVEVNSFAELAANPEGLRKWQSQLVKFNNVHFENGGNAQFSEYHSSGVDQKIVDASDATLVVRTSGYSNFWNKTLPEGQGDVCGILGYYNTSWQLTLIDYNGCMNFGNPTLTPGSKENPYTVAQAVELETAGTTAAGWVKGYIVGAVAPDVQTITGNNDIEWTAPTVLANTLVIGNAKDTKDINQCVVISLPSGSPLQNLGNLRSNPENLGKEILVRGRLEKYMGTFGIAGNRGSATEFEIEGVAVENGEVPNGDGTEASPYNAGQVIKLDPQSKDVPVESGVFVEGYIVGYMASEPMTILSNTQFTAEGAVATNIVLGPTADCTDYTRCISVKLPVGAIRNALNLQSNPSNLGKRVVLGGDIAKYCGAPGIINLTSHKFTDSSQGGGDGPNPPIGGNGNGTADDPYDTAAILSYNPQSTTEAVAKDIFVKGYIVGYMPAVGTSIEKTIFNATDAVATNLVLAPTADCKDYTLCISIQLPFGAIRESLNLKDNPGHLGKEVVLEGDVYKYCGTAGLKNTSSYKFTE